MRELLIQSIPYLLPILVPLIGGYLSMLARKYVRNDSVLKALQVIGHVAEVAVANAAQKTVADLKDPNKEGTWDKVAAQAVKKSVSDDVRTMGQQSLTTLMNHGWTEGQAEMLVDRTIESAVNTLKRVSITPPAPAVTSPPEPPPAPPTDGAV